MPALALEKNVRLPIEVVTSTVAVLGKKGSGKTYTAKKLAELMLDSGFQVVILDIVGVWWGLKSSADGKSAGYSIPIFGGKRPDIPLEPTAGEVTARAIVEGGFSCIVDIGQFSKTKRHQFAAAFLEELYQRNEHAMHLIVDEADFYAPQKPISPQASICLGAMDELVRRGRQRGIGVSLITQRPQVLNKDVLTQADLLIALRLNHPLDIKSIMEWVKVKADAKEAQAMLDALPGLPTGDFFAWAPELDLFARGKADPARTFDSSATPKPGQHRTAPKVLAPIDIKKLGERIQATVDEQKANDPALLKRKIAELEREMEQVRKGTGMDVGQHNRELNELRSTIDAVRLEGKSIASTGVFHLDRLEEMARRFAGEIETARGILGGHASGRASKVPVMLPEPHVPKVADVKITPETLKPTNWTRVSNLPPAPEGAVSRSSNGNLPTSQRIFLSALMQHGPLTRPQLGFYAKYSPTSSTFDNIVGALRSGGLATKGWPIEATSDGKAAVGTVDPAPTGPELMADVMTRLGGTPALLFAVLYERGSVDRTELADYAGRSPGSSTFDNAIGRLRSLDLATKGWPVDLTPWLRDKIGWAK